MNSFYEVPFWFFHAIAGYGNFTFKMDFYKTAAFGTPHSQYPIKVDLNKYVYVQYSVESSAHLVIMAENCKATKNESPYSWPQYSIIQNGYVQMRWAFFSFTLTITSVGECHKLFKMYI